MSPRVQLRAESMEYPVALRPALEGRWAELPDELSVEELNILAHLVNAYEIRTQHPEVRFHPHYYADDFRAHRTWPGSALELFVAFFEIVRSWRGLYDGPVDGDEHHAVALACYRALRDRLRAHPHEVVVLPASPPDAP